MGQLLWIKFKMCGIRQCYEQEEIIASSYYEIVSCVHRNIR